MAEISKYKIYATGSLLRHNNRTADDGASHNNAEIDLERTCLNYHFKKGNVNDINKRLQNPSFYYMKRDNQIALVEMIVTLPKDVKQDDEYKFFQSVYNFACMDFGADNIINAVVHKDETTPHIHIDFVPILPIEKVEKTNTMQTRIKNYEFATGVPCKGVVNAKYLMPREYFRTLHPRLYEYVKNDLGYACEIINGATANGNRTVLELKNQVLEEKIANKEEQLSLIDKNIMVLNRNVEHLGLDKAYCDYYYLLNDMSYLKKENDILRGLVMKHHIPLPSFETEELIRLSRELTQSNVVCKSGAFCPTGDAVLIETFRQKERILPQRRYIESSRELEYVIDTIRPRELYERPFGGKTFIFLPTDSLEETIRSLMKLKENEKRYTSISIPQISNDTYNFALNILRQCQFESEYFIAEKKRMDWELTREQTKIVG